MTMSVIDCETRRYITGRFMPPHWFYHDYGYGGVAIFRYTEAWPIPVSGTGTEASIDGNTYDLIGEDHFEFEDFPDRTYGSVKIAGRYTEVRGNIPSDFVPGLVPEAGGLPSTWGYFGETAHERDHVIEVQWFCCDTPQTSTQTIGPAGN